MADFPSFPKRGERGARRQLPMAAPAFVFLLFMLIIASWMVYSSFRVDVGKGEMGILIHKIGKDLPNGEEVAPSDEYKGVQRDVLIEARHFRNPYAWTWEVVPQMVIPPGKIGVKVSLTGDDLGYGEFLSRVDAKGAPLTKGIMPGILNPGRYTLNPYMFSILLAEPVTIPAGFKGVVTNLAGPLPKKPNELLVEPGERGVQKIALEPGTHPVNPYLTRINLVDCRSQRFNLGEEGDMGFPSKDGFWVSLDGVIEFRVNPEKAPEVYVLFNQQDNGELIDEELVRTVIMPNARSFCRLQGSNSSGREFIQGTTRTKFQETFETSMREACQPLGIEVIQALVTKIRPPQQIATPVREREIAKQQELQYQQQILQQESERKLAVEKAMVIQKQALVAAEQDVVKVTTKAKQEQQVALTKADEQLAVAKLKLDASMDEAAAIEAKGQAAADVIRFENEAESAGWKKAVESFSGDGQAYAQFVLYQKLASSYRRIMVNTADSPMMKIFDDFADAHAASSATPGAKPIPPVSPGEAATPMTTATP